MLFTTPTEYAIRGLTELVGRYQGGLILLEEVLEGTELPVEFMKKLFQRLVRAGILTSSKGRGGGFALARPPNQITLMQIVAAMEGPNPVDGCVVGLGKCNDQVSCALHDIYKPIRQRLKDSLNGTTLADMAASLMAKKSWQKDRKGKIDPSVLELLRRELKKK